MWETNYRTNINTIIYKEIQWVLLLHSHKNEHYIYDKMPKWNLRVFKLKTFENNKQSCLSWSNKWNLGSTILLTKNKKTEQKPIKNSALTRTTSMPVKSNLQPPWLYISTAALVSSKSLRLSSYVWFRDHSCA